MADDAPSTASLLPRKLAARFSRCESNARDELRSFRACLAWLCVDHSSVQLARSFRVLCCFVLPCALAEAAYKAYWYAAAAPAFRSPRWAAVEVASWVYRVALFFMVCVLFRVICYLQILRMVGFAREFGRFADVATVLQHHRRIKEQVRKISHRYRKFIVGSLVLVSASQFAALQFSIVTIRT